MTAAKNVTATESNTKPAAPAATKEPKMATKDAVKLDYASMSVADMLKLSQELATKAAEASQKEFDSTMNFLVNEKLPSMGRSKLEAIQAVYELMADDERKDFNNKFREALKMAASYKPAGTRKPRSPNGSAPKKPDQPFVRGTTYVDPTGAGKEWTAGLPGQKPKWLKDAVEGLDFAAAQAKYVQYAKK